MRVLITAGPTREPLDPVRYISNASTGKQGVELARAALARGWEVEVVHGPLEIALPGGARGHAVLTAADMMRECLRLHPDVDAVVGAAAVSDFRPRTPLKSKQRRAASGWTLELEPTRDILRELGRVKGDRVHVGFALETEAGLENARRKLQEKRLDWIVMNDPSAIGSETAEYTLLGRDGPGRQLGTLSKAELAIRVCDLLERP